MKTLSEKFNTIAVRKGDFFAVELPANPSTGYLWDVRVTQGQAKKLGQEVLDDEPKTRNGERSIGGGYTERTIWQAQADGVIELTAEWKRPWEKSVAPVKRHIFTVKPL